VGEVTDDHAEHRAKGDGHEFERRRQHPREKSEAEMAHLEHVQAATKAKAGEDSASKESKPAPVVGGRRAGGGFKGRNVKDGMANMWLYFSFGWGLVLTVMARYLFCPPSAGKARRKGRSRRHEIPNRYYTS
jgi:hypothetical protein